MAKDTLKRAAPTAAGIDFRLYGVGLQSDFGMPSRGPKSMNEFEREKQPDRNQQLRRDQVNLCFF
jgi:hypothetical protein